MPRPTVEEGIGQKSSFPGMGLKLSTHKSSEFKTDDNIFKIIIESPKMLKTTFKLTMYADDKTEELPNAVFSQQADNKLVFHLALPQPAWYKFNIFAAEIDSPDSSIPNVFTYLFELTKAKKKVCDYPKQFADFNKGCYLKKPKYLDPSKKMDDIEFKVDVPNAKRVAVKAKDEWTHLNNTKGNTWEGTVQLEGYKTSDKSNTVNLNACTGDDETSFATLVQYNI